MDKKNLDMDKKELSWIKIISWIKNFVMAGVAMGHRITMTEWFRYKGSLNVIVFKTEYSTAGHVDKRIY